jgi:hypothetical protein
VKVARFVSSSAATAAAFLLGAVVFVGAARAEFDDAKRLETLAARMRGEPARANAEIAALKRSDRGVGDEYRLRKRMSDAEGLARKLTETEAELRRRSAAAGSVARGRSNVPLVGPEIKPEPHDGPVELEAKAALLADQAKRLAAEAQALTRTAGQIRTRQALRRRAGNLDRDPFAGLDAPNRTMVFSASKSASPTTGFGGSTAEKAADSRAAAAPGAAAANAPPSETVTAVGTSLQFRTLIDQQTLTEIRRLEGSGKPLANAEALDKAAAALKQRAQTLEAEAKVLRNRAKP